MIYKRSKTKVFTLSSILDQIVEFVKKYKRLPKTICLPPEEFVFMPYLMPGKHLYTGCDQFIGIPLEVNYEKQKVPFQGV